MQHDVFQEADAYELYVGRWSRQLTPVFVRWLGVPLQGRWLDVGCGTGSLTEAILANAFPAAVVGVDPSSSFVARASEAVRDPRVSFRVGNAMSLEFASGTFDVAAAALALNFTPDPNVAVDEMRRVVKRGGRVGAFVWDYSAGMRMMRVFWDAAVEVDPAAAQLDEGRRFSITRPDLLRSCFLAAGLQRVELLPLEAEMVFSGFDDYWRPFLGGQGSAPAYAMSLPADQREKVVERIRAKLTPEADGSIRMTSRAWAVHGTVG